MVERRYRPNKNSLHKKLFSGRELFFSRLKGRIRIERLFISLHPKGQDYSRIEKRFMACAIRSTSSSLSSGLMGSDRISRCIRSVIG